MASVKNASSDKKSNKLNDLYCDILTRRWAQLKRQKSEKAITSRYMARSFSSI
jgi:hypothetical protein